MNEVEPNNDLSFNTEDDFLKRSNTEKNLFQKKNSVLVKPVHGKKSIFVETDIDLTKNNGI